MRDAFGRERSEKRSCGLIEEFVDLNQAFAVARMPVPRPLPQIDNDNERFV
jgi:hypothetical protein